MRKIIVLLLLTLSICTIASEPITQQYDISELISNMLSNNADIRNADQDIYDSALDVKDAKAKLYPTIDLTLSGTYMVEPPIKRITVSSDELFSSLPVQNVPGLQNGGYMTIYDGMDDTLYSASLSMTQVVNSWGKLNLAVDLYQTVENIHGIRRNDIERQLRAELMIRLFVLDNLGKANDRLLEALSIANELVLIAEKSYLAGVILESDYIDAKLGLLNLEMRRAELEKEIKSNLSSLSILTGISDLEHDQLELDLDDSALMKYRDVSYLELKNLALSSSNDSLQMISKLNSVHLLQEKIANRSMYGIPDMAIQVSAGYSTPRFPALEAGWRAEDSFTLNISFALQTNLWDGGERLNDVKRAQSSQIRDDISYSEALLSIENVLSENYYSMQNAIMKLEVLEEKSTNLDTILRNTELSEEIGQKGRRDVLSAKLEIIENDIEKLLAKSNLASNVFMISYLIGVGPDSY